jgi:hypothetical protein
MYRPNRASPVSAHPLVQQYHIVMTAYHKRTLRNRRKRSWRCRRKSANFSSRLLIKPEPEIGTLYRGPMLYTCTALVQGLLYCIHMYGTCTGVPILYTCTALVQGLLYCTHVRHLYRGSYSVHMYGTCTGVPILYTCTALEQGLLYCTNVRQCMGNYIMRFISVEDAVITMLYY